jgi:hypothetical protein
VTNSKTHSLTHSCDFKDSLGLGGVFQVGQAYSCISNLTHCFSMGMCTKCSRKLPKPLTNKCLLAVPGAMAPLEDGPPAPMTLEEKRARQEAADKKDLKKTFSISASMPVSLAGKLV